IVPAAFENSDYLAQIHQIEDDFATLEARALEQLQADAERRDVSVKHRMGQFTFVPTHEGHALSPDEFEKLPEAARQEMEKAVNDLQAQLQKILEIDIPGWRRESQTRVKDLNRKTMVIAVGQSIHSLMDKYRDLPQVCHYLEQVEDDIVDNMDAFRRPEENSNRQHLLQISGDFMQRYRVNLLVDNDNLDRAPVIYEDRPSFGALIGRIEHTSQLGTLITDFTQIKPGALHLANGGYLMLDAHKLLTQPFAWDGLKRVLKSGEIRIESLAELLSLVSTVSLQPEPVPLEVKVILFGDRLLYYLLHEFDPDFPELFKVAADFDTESPRSFESEQMYMRLIATLARKHGLRPFDSGAVAAMIQYGMRLIEDTTKLSMHMRSISDLMQEANYWAGEAGCETVTAAHARQAWDARIMRNSRSRDHAHESIRRGTTMIDTSGTEIGQINGLTVIELGGFRYGMPARITATTRMGEGEMIDIEHETELGGPIHSKGVFILSSFLGARYSRNVPLSLTASLTFEQSYSGVEGDSASLAELCAILSSLAGVPLSQSLGVTGSVNQLGKVQAIGGVNEKIEGFFDICKQAGLNGHQGVIIPAVNTEHLMLRDDVVKAARKDRFFIYPVNTVDDAIELLTGLPAGAIDTNGLFAAGTFNNLVQSSMMDMATIRHAFGEMAKEQVEVSGNKNSGKKK
ncbi:MAG: ATP-binding protein, partial [Gammaproteobacteria bacterium]